MAFGLATTLMHYSAMVFTRFDIGGSNIVAVDPLLSSGLLAMIVALTSFVISGLFLLMAIPVGASPAGATAADANPVASADALPETATASSAAAMVLSKAYSDGGVTQPDRNHITANRIPYERDKTIRFFSAEQIAAVRAEGHYSQVINGAGEYFCPWPISKVEETIGSDGFIRTHRSYLVNLDHVSGFRREGDKAYCFVNGSEDRPIPVSRSRISDVQDALGLG